MSQRRGFALVATLWLLVALTSAVLEVSLTARTRRLAAANTLEAVSSRAAARAGLDHARARMATILARSGTLSAALPPEARLDPWRDPAELLPDSLLLGEARYAVRLRDAGAALHLNRASEDELRRLFLALRVDAGEADRLAQAILDWRDADDLRRARGAERDDYLGESRAELPRNGPFASLDELLAVRGMTAERFAAVRQYLTLLGTGQVNLNAAARPVLLALPGLTEEAVAVLLRRRQGRRPVRSVQELTLELSPPARRAIEAELPRLLSRATFETREVEVESEGWVAGSPVRVRAEGLLVRTNDVVFLVQTRVEW